MKDTDRIRAIAAALLDKSVDNSSIDRGAQLLKLASETENQVAQAAKYAVEEQKLKDDLSDSSSRRRSEERRSYLSILAPLFTTVVLAGTLVLQSYQFKEQRKEAADTARRQIDAAEDERWNQAIKALSDQKLLSPAAVLFATFSQSPRYRDKVYAMAQGVLINSNTPKEEFAAVLGNFFEPVDWFNLKWILAADRSIRSAEDVLSNKTWDGEKNDLSRLTPAERATYDQRDAEVQTLGDKVGQLLKGQRPGDVALDLKGTAFWRCDWRGADLSGADLTGSRFFHVDLDGANLSGITHFQGVRFQQVAWWNAATISPQLLEYLLNDELSRYNPKSVYGTGASSVLPADYEVALIKLKKASSIP